MLNFKKKDSDSEGVPKNIYSNLKYFVLGGMVLLLLAYPFVMGRGDLPTLMMFLGSLAFAPMGMALGVVIFDPYMRTKVLRNATKKNLGIVHIVNGRDIVRKMKNFDNDILEIGNGWYSLIKGRIYQDKNLITSVGDSEKLKYMGGVPVVFLDRNTLTPLSFFKDDLKINPQDFASPMKSELALKKLELMKQVGQKAGIAVIGLLVAIGITVYFSYNANSHTDTLLSMMSNVQHNVNVLVNSSGVR